MQTDTEASDDTTQVRSYAIRRVNPFLGVLQIIETEAGRAVSANGVVWDIEVRAERSGSWGSLNRNSGEQAYYRYGLWSLQDGLVSRPLAPHLDNDPLTQKCKTLIDCVVARLDSLPFALQDYRELWLFDSLDQRPLALLASATADSALPSPAPKYWSCSIGLHGVPSQRRYPAASELEAQVKQAAGFNINRHWIQRRQDGSGMGIDDNREIDAEQLPTFLLTENWPDAEQKKLAQQYIEWISPSLLSLQQLSRIQRQRMEKCLHKQALSVEHHWHLYPEIIDEKLLTAARVQCQLQMSNLMSKKPES